MRKQKLEDQKKKQDEKMVETVFALKGSRTSKFLSNDIPSLLKKHYD
jgi:hypothetical protein